MEGATSPMTAFIELIGNIITAILGWVPKVTVLMTTDTLLVFSLGFFALGGVIGIIGRLLRRN